MDQFDWKTLLGNIPYSRTIQYIPVEDLRLLVHSTGGFHEPCNSLCRRSDELGESDVVETAVAIRRQIMQRFKISGDPRTRRDKLTI